MSVAVFLAEPVVRVRFVSHAAAAVATRRHVAIMSVDVESNAMTRVAASAAAHSADLQDLCVLSPSRVATVASDGSVSVWANDADDGLVNLAATASVHVGAASCVASQRRSARLVSGGDDGRLAVRSEARFDAIVALFDGDGAAVTRVAFDGDEGDGLVSVNAVGQLCFWDARVHSHRPVKAMRDGVAARELWALAAHPARPTVVATGAADGSVSVWDTRAELWPLSRSQAHSGAVWDVAFSALGERLVSVGHDGSVLQWDVGATSAVTELLVHEAPLYAADAHAANDGVLAGSGSGCLLLTRFHRAKNF